MHEGCEHCSHQGEQISATKLVQWSKSSNSIVAAAESGANAELLTRREAASLLGIAEQTLAAWKTRCSYSLPVIKIGRMVRYRRSDLEAFLKQNTWTAHKKRGVGRGR